MHFTSLHFLIIPCFLLVMIYVQQPSILEDGFHMMIYLLFQNEVNVFPHISYDHFLHTNENVLEKSTCIHSTPKESINF